MSGTHDHPHDHPHDRGHAQAPLPPALDAAVPDEALDHGQLGRRRFLQGAGVLGAGAAAASVLARTPAAAADDAPAVAPRSKAEPEGGYRWLAGDHHIHTQFSPDGQYRVIDQVQHANAYGLDWMVDHRPRQRHALPDRRRPRQPEDRPGPPAGARDAGVPGPGVEHPGRRARHRDRAPGPQRGRRPSSSSRSTTTAPAPAPPAPGRPAAPRTRPSPWPGCTTWPAR